MPVDEADLDWTETDGEDGTTAFRRKKLAAADGGEAIGASLYELDPGARSWPYHYHEANAEAIYVLAGEGTLRLDGDEHPLAPGTYAALPVGASGGHRVVNDGEEPLRYLMVSTMVEPDVTVYPDSGKIGVYAGSPPGGTGERDVYGFWRRADDVHYWDGEGEGEADAADGRDG